MINKTEARILGKSMSKFDISGMDTYLAKVKALKGTKQKMANPVVRALYESKSVDAGRWLSVEEFKASI